MRTLAHYTVYNGNVYKLHIFSFSKNGVIDHRPVQTETANTLFIEGLLLLSPQLQDDELNAISRHLKSGVPTAKIAESIAETLPHCTPKSPLFATIASIPFCGFRPIKIE